VGKISAIIIAVLFPIFFAFDQCLPVKYIEFDQHFSSNLYFIVYFNIIIQLLIWFFSIIQKRWTQDYSFINWTDPSFDLLNIWKFVEHAKICFSLRKKELNLCDQKIMNFWLRLTLQLRKYVGYQRLMQILHFMKVHDSFTLDANWLVAAETSRLRSRT
jgi:hypothetical protein